MRSEPGSPGLSSIGISVASLAIVFVGADIARLERGASAAAPAQLALRIANYASMPITGSPDGTGNNAGSLARISFLREEPAPARRFFVNDLTGPLYILDPATKQVTTYLDLNGRGARTGLFHKMAFETGLASGFISFQFDPDYARNGKFYTIHLEETAAPGTLMPDNAHFPGLAVADYRPTPPIPTPGTVDHESVLVEWTDWNISNSTFEGTARELLRVPLNSRIHPMGDLIFNPLARRGDPDWRVLYVACGDGGSGDRKTGPRLNPQRLDTVAGKILRIIPDLTEHADASIVSDNGRYRIPRDNPFVTMDGARKEIWAYGLRNPHRLSWDVDPANHASNHLIAAVVGLNTWETVAIIHRGANYGFPEREGTERLLADNTTGTVPEPDTIPVHLTDTTTRGTVVPTYPVVQYGHIEGGGDAIAGGFVYRGRAVPELRGKYVLGDTSTGRLWWIDYAEMLKADAARSRAVAEMHELRISWDDLDHTPDRGRLYPTLAPIVSAGYHARGGKAAVLPGKSTLSPSGRVDLRLAVDGRGELYVLTKSDGMIRAVTGVVAVTSTQSASATR